MLTYLVLLVLPWMLALGITPVVMRWATRHGWLDHPKGRKQHRAPVPLLGGVAVFVSMWLGLALSLPVSEPVRAGLWGQGSLSALALGVGLIVALGLWDDRVELRPLGKLAGQVVVALLSWSLGFRMGLLELPFGWLLGADPLSSLLLTVAWIVVVTNAFNLMDGMDGLASGISVISLLTVFLLANQNGATVPVIGALALSGALAGFLRFNVPPARIFLGDAGSMGVGYATAVLALASYNKGPTAIVLIVPLMVLGVPLLDTVLAIVRRVRNYLLVSGRSELRAGGVLRAIASADRGHIHHLLLRMGLSVSQVLAVLYASAAGLAVLGVATRAAGPEVRWGLWLGLIGASYGVLSMLEQRVARREARARDRDAQLAALSAPADADAAERGRQHVAG